jgi:hypothetical protein
MDLVIGHRHFHIDLKGMAAKHPAMPILFRQSST